MKRWFKSYVAAQNVCFYGQSEREDMVCVLMRFRGNGRLQLIFFIALEMHTVYEERKGIVGFG